MDVGPEYVTVGWFQWVVGGLAAAVIAVLGVAAAFRREMSNRTSVLFTKLDSVRDSAAAHSKENERALYAYRQEVSEKYATVTHLHEVEGRIVNELREINRTLKEILKADQRHFGENGNGER